MMGVFVQLNEGSRNAKAHPTGYVIQENGCWDWTGAVAGRGYGYFTAGGRNGYGAHPKRTAVYVHRWMYEKAKGEIPAGMEIDHLCRNIKCCNPDHLEVVDRRENNIRSNSATAKNAKKTHCKRGHEFTPENTYRRGPELRYRRCATCHKAWQNNHYRASRAKPTPYLAWREAK